MKIEDIKQLTDLYNHLDSNLNTLKHLKELDKSIILGEAGSYKMISINKEMKDIFIQLLESKIVFEMDVIKKKLEN